MRKLGKGQKIVFVVTKNCLELFETDAISIEQLISFCKKNQEKRLKTLIFRSSLQKMKNIVRNHLLKELRRKQNFHEKTIDLTILILSHLLPTIVWNWGIL